MKRQLVIRPAAETDILNAAQWYEDQREGLGCEFTSAIHNAIQEALEHPTSYRLLRRVPPVRRILVRRFPYRLFYIVQADRIVVFAVTHGKQHEGHWQERLS